MSSNRFRLSALIGVIFLLTVLLFMNYFMKDWQITKPFARGVEINKRTKQTVIPHLAVVACGVKFDEALTMVKSAVLFTKTSIMVHVVVDSMLQKRKFESEFDSWPPAVRARMDYNIYYATFPANFTCKNCKKDFSWASLFKPCASQRLFLSSLLPDVDSVIYVDADTVFLAPIEELWSVIYRFNSSQFLGVAPDSDLPNMGVYSRRTIPKYGINGINSGVLLMNLTRLRTSMWPQLMTNYMIEYGERLKLGDNDLINIFLHDNPEFGYMLTCDWNYHAWQCIKCDQSQKTGVALLHGCMGAFRNKNTLPFKAIYLAFKQFELGIHSIKRDLLPTIQLNLYAMKGQKSLFPNTCHKNPSVYTQRIRNMISLDEIRRSRKTEVRSTKYMP